MKQRDPVKNIIFDLGGVILNWDPRSVIARFTEDVDAQDRLYSSIYSHPDWLEYDRGMLSEKDAVAIFAERTGSTHGAIASLLHETMVSLTVKQDSLDLLYELHGQNVNLFCLSNMPAEAYEFVSRRYSFFEIFRGIVISAHLKLIKPDPRIFEHLLRNYGLDPAETLFLDDNQENINAAESLGVYSILFEDAKNCRSRLKKLLGCGQPTQW
jgi:putative hydrolase of the HAD superfamily